MKFIGVMNGTSLDGVDWVLCDVQKNRAKLKVEYRDSFTTPFSKNLKLKLKKCAQHKSSLKELLDAHNHLGRYYCKSLERILKKKKWKFDGIGLHGQTVYHKGSEASLQIGETSFLRQVFEVPVVSDFRVADIAAGGQGAPLAPIFHREVFAPFFKDKKISVHNLGGISNVTYFQVDKKGEVSQEIAFDTGPANMPIDLAMQKLSLGKKSFDRNGRWAFKGNIDEKSLQSLLKNKYFKKKCPKSCGREEFGEVFLEESFRNLKGKSSFDKIRTLTELTARSIELSYRKLLPQMPDVMILCGGGAKNIFLVQRLKELLPEVSICTTEDFNWPVSAVEGGAFALLAAMRVWEIPVDNHRLTGASRSTFLGKIT